MFWRTKIVKWSFKHQKLANIHISLTYVVYHYHYDLHISNVCNIFTPQIKAQTVVHNWCTGWNKYSHHWKLTNTRFYHQQLWNAIIYYCYCMVFVDLPCIFEFTMCLWIFFVILHIARRLLFLANSTVQNL